jgi:NAD(P)H-hydrate epimerase
MPDSQPSLSRQQAREIDARAIGEYGLSGLVLMENAGRGCAGLLERLGISGPVCICVGKGNNGGDGYVIARHLDNSGHTVRIASAVDPSTLEGDAEANHRVWVAGGGAVEVVSAAGWDSVLEGSGWIVDALLGTGIRGEVQPPFDEAIDAINGSSVPVLAIDLPSGLDCDTGEVLGRCVRADQTATMVASKRGMLVEGAGEWTGEVHMVDIGIPRVLREAVLR